MLHEFEFISQVNLQFFEIFQTFDHPLRDGGDLVVEKRPDNVRKRRNLLEHTTKARMHYF